MPLHTTIITFMIFLAPTLSWSKVFIRWTQPSVPSPTSLGVDELVVPVHAKSLITNARKAGYRVYVEVPISQVSSASRIPFMPKLGGIFLNPGNQTQKQINSSLVELRATLPNLTIRVLEPRGQQPEMKGQLVTEQDGILQVSSATAQPWITSNLAMIRFAQLLQPRKIPIYSFEWNPPDGTQELEGPEAADYLLAMAEAGAFHADLILGLHEKLQKDLLQDNRTAWETVGSIKRYLAFSSEMTGSSGHPEANVGVVVGEYAKSYEPVNLLARHNLPFQLLRSVDLHAKQLKRLDVLVILRTISKDAATVIESFADKGGVVVLFASNGPYPWRFNRRAESSRQFAFHEIGKGRIIELGNLAGDPESFAQDIRRLIDNRKIAMSLWNALTTVAVSYGQPEGDGRVVELVNYAQEPLSVQVQVKGSFLSIRYESPEEGCCKALSGVQREGYTEFVVPGVTIAGRVHLATQSADGH